MSPNIDRSIVNALSVDPSQTKISSYGGSGFSSTLKITSIVDGKEKRFFMKIGKGMESEIMFAGTIFSSLMLNDV
jgi:protein-ribulosamine 3-kinase